MKLLTLPVSGSLRGDTFARNRFGYYVRNRTTPVNPNTTAQSYVRELFGETSSAWRGLTAYQRAAWESYALDHPVNNRLGQQVILTGQAYYVKVNVMRGRNGQAAIADPPGNLSLFSFVFDSLDCYIDGTDSHVDLYFTSAGSSSDKIEVMVSPLVSPGVGFNGDWRWISVLNGNTSSPHDASTQYVYYRGPLVVGSRLFARMRPITDGSFPGPWQNMYADVYEA